MRVDWRHRCALAGLLACLAQAFAAGAFDLPQLMQALGRLKSGEAVFVERRHVSMLDQPLVSSGRLSFEAPDIFVRETLKPRQERIAVNGNTLTIQQGDRTRTLALDSAPEAGVIVEAIRGTLTGNREALERNFKASLSGDAELWLLELVPRESRLRAQVLSVRVAGHQGVVREVLVSLPDGDRSVMSIEPMSIRARATAHPASAAP
jgi:outer membrane lipoprotein-sorting protein